MLTCGPTTITPTTNIKSLQGKMNKIPAARIPKKDTQKEKYESRHVKMLKTARKTPKKLADESTIGATYTATRAMR